MCFAARSRGIGIGFGFEVKWDVDCDGLSGGPFAFAPMIARASVEAPDQFRIGNVDGCSGAEGSLGSFGQSMSSTGPGLGLLGCLGVWCASDKSADTI